MEKDEPGELVLNDSRNFTDHELFDFPPEDKSVQLEFAVEEETLPEADKILNEMSAVGSENRSVNVTEPVVEDERPLPEPPEKRPFEPKITKVENIPIDEDKRKSGEDLFLAELAEPSPVPVPKIQEKITVEEINKVLQEIPLPEVPAEEEKDDDFHYINDRSFIRSVVREVKKEPEKPKPIVVGELFRTYVVAQVGDEMLLMDKHAAHERYIFEKIKKDISELETQMLLEPVMVMLSYDEFDALAANLDKLSRLGFEIEPDVAPTVAVKGVPIILGDSENPTDIVTELARNFIQCRNNPQLEIFDDLYHSIACKAAIKANDNNSTIELQALLNAVYGNENIRYCPHGRPVIITLSKKDIEKQFRRLV